jgi:hypothetical protein
MSSDTIVPGSGATRLRRLGVTPAESWTQPGSPGRRLPGCSGWRCGAVWPFWPLQLAVRAPQALSSMISGTTAGQPGWLASLDGRLSAMLSHRGLAAAVVLAVILTVVAVGIYLPPPAARAAVALAIAVAIAIWIAEGLGGVLTGAGTDPNSGPLLALLALAYWPVQGPSAELGPGPAGALAQSARVGSP